MNASKTRYNSFDCLKAIACIAVVLIHFPFPGELGVWQQAVSKIGVPVFFIISGFFLLPFDDAVISTKLIFKKIKHILHVCVASGVFYSAFTLFTQLVFNKNKDLIAYTLERFKPERVLKFFVTNDPLLYSHLWFLLALIYCYLFMLIFKGNKHIGAICLLAPILLISYCYFQEFPKFLGIPGSVAIPGTKSRIYFFNLFLCRALPFFLFGILLKRNLSKVLRFPLKKWGAALLVLGGSLIAVWEAHTFYKSQFYIGTYIVLFAFFTMAVKKPQFDIPFLSYIGRELSLYVYILHIAIGRTLGRFIGVAGLRKHPVYLYSEPILVIILSLAFALLLVICKKIIVSEYAHKENSITYTFKKHRFLFEELVKRDFKKKYKRTVLGMAWSVLSPLLMLLVMRLVFTHFFGNRISHYTTYLFCGTLIFSYFSESSGQGMQSLMGNAAIFSKVNVPKYLFLLSKNVQTLVNFALTLIVFFLFCALDGITFTWRFLLLVYPIFCLVLFNIGVGLILSAMFVFFRDIQYLWSIFIQLLMYVSAVFYSIDSYSYPVRCAFLLNPIYLFIRYFRKIIIDGNIPTIWFHLLMAADVVIVLSIGCLIYKKYNRRFLYYV